MIKKYDNNYEIIGRSVIGALDQAYRMDTSESHTEDEKIYSSYTPVTDNTIRESKLKLRRSLA